MAAGNLLVGQSGGATAVINASLVGVIAAALEAREVGAIVGMRHGIEGLLREELIDLRQQPAGTLERLRRTPSSALGTCRHKLRDDDLDRAMAIIRRYEVRYFLYIGGNDSADTAHRLHERARAEGYDLRVMSIPKTIDNDLPYTDHCPGYGSIARFLALATRDAGRDTEAFPKQYPVKIIEVMGRNAGWVAAACALARDDARDAPQLIFLPERPPASMDAVLGEIEAAQREHGYCVAIVPETLHDANGQHLSGGERAFVDAFGHAYFPGLGPLLAERSKRDLGLPARYDKPGTMARMAMMAASSTDLAEAEAAGREAVRRAVAGESDRMITILRESDEPYRVGYGVVPLDRIANTEHLMPDAFIGADGRSVTAAFRRYALPLLGEPLPEYGRIAPIPFTRGNA
ncbi:MAG: diphosphate--fructose-6-phosphate 1-phosphotransferase [Chloroflexia bacterium]